MRIFCRRQATQELLNKRNAIAEKLCRLDDSFGEKEKSYKAQVHSLTQQIKKDQASRVRAESQAETYKTAGVHRLTRSLQRGFLTK